MFKHRSFRSAALLSLLFLFLPLTALAQAPHWGTGVSGSTGTSQFSSSGIPGFPIDNYQATPSTMNHTDANAVLFSESDFEGVSGIATPLLLADTDATLRGDSVAWAVNAYTYAGPTKTLTITAQLDATIMTEGFVRSRIYVMDQFDGEGLYDGTTEQSTPSFFFEGFFPLANISSSSFSLDENDVPGQVIDSDSFTVNDGDTFYLWMNILASSFQGSTESMVSIAFDDNTGLTSAAPVPEPGTVLGLACGTGFLALAGVRRRR